VRKRALFDSLADASLSSAKDVLNLHELLVFARAYPDDKGVLASVETVLGAFESRRDLRRHREELANSGIAGTEIRYEFFYPTAVALARRFPGRLRIDWLAWKRKQDLVSYLALLVPYAEQPALDEWEREPREWIDFLRSDGEQDGVFLALRFTAMDASSFVREVIYDNLSPAMILEPGPGVPTRTRAKAPVQQVVFQSGPLDTSRPDLVKATRSWRVRVREVARREASLYVRMVSDAMVTRSRDLDAFAYASVDDVRICDFDDGFTLAVLGVIPERRLLLDSMYGALTMKNGVPIGYVLFSSLFESTAVAFNVFDTFRGAETAGVFSRVLAVGHRLFGARTFSIDPYQLGHFGNHEGLASGAWWFYYKLGFRPRDRGVLRLVTLELRKMNQNRKHRSSLATLEDLSAAPMFFSLGGRHGISPRALSPGRASEQVTRLLARRYGAARERGIADSSRETAALCGIRSFAEWSPDELQAWERWSPLLLAVPGFATWSVSERRAAGEIARSKGGTREADYHRKLNAHAKLRHALLRMLRSD
jgi:hypothetical protein